MSKAKAPKKKKAVRDWIAIRNEYASTDIGLRGLAEKYSIPLTTIRDRSRREGWVALREEQHHTIAQKTAQKTAEVVAQDEAGRVARLLRIADQLMDRTEQALAELDQQAVRHKETIKTSATTSDEEGRPVKTETAWEIVDVETVSAIVDRKGLQQIATSAKAIKDILTATADDSDSGSLDDLIAALREIGGGDG